MTVLKMWGMCQLSGFAVIWWKFGFTFLSQLLGPVGLKKI